MEKAREKTGGQWQRGQFLGLEIGSERMEEMVGIGQVISARKSKAERRKRNQERKKES